ncbi:uncharacterized protein LOC132544320 [Ylistrum balloti]|uniref:uncharacterized protein LOC132544320 n=1 Tax=Ylistrum balloti TaxID=509963 RepID=UPI0029058720|nr:uncharacterized protein LOC132544320 [Ylistrum balloti]
MGDKYGSDVYLPMPVNRDQLGQRKVEKIQREIERLEKEQVNKKELIERLSRLQQNEDRQKEIQNNVLNRHNKDQLLLAEKERTHGRDSVASIKNGENIDSVIAQRTKEYSRQQNAVELEARFLVQERDRLQAAREKVREQRRALQTMTPADSVLSAPDIVQRGGGSGARPYSRLSVATPERAVHSVDATIKDTIKTLPQTVDKIMRLRQDVQRHYEKYKRPYRGEMGIQSYKPQQIEHYFLVRAILDDVVTGFLDSYFKPAIPLVEKEAYTALVEKDSKDLEKAAIALSERKAVQLIMEELVLDVTADMTKEAVDEQKHTYGMVRNMAFKELMNRTEAIVLGEDQGRQPNDQGYSMVTKTFFGYQQQRNRQRMELWGHSQPFTVKAAPQRIRKKKPEKKKKEEVADEEGEKDDEEDPDIIVLEYHQIIPVDIRAYEPIRTDTPDVKRTKRIYQTYMNKEVEYWSRMEATLHRIDLPKRCGGVLSMARSPNQRFLAVGTIHGDCIVYDTWTAPWRPIKVIVNNQKGNDAILYIAWSLDNSRLITTTASGLVNIWSFLGGGLRKADTKSLGIQPDSDGQLPKQLGLMFQFDVDENDFMFYQGPFVEQETLTQSFTPTVASFYPSFTLFGIQNMICIALENGDVLKADLEYALGSSGSAEFTEAPKILNQMNFEELEGINVIGKGIEAELLRRHKTIITFMGYVDNINRMVTVDTDGYIMLWKLDSENMTTTGWYVPEFKYRIAASKAMYTPITKEKPKVRGHIISIVTLIFTSLQMIFTDRLSQMPGERPRTLQEIAKQRKTTQTTLDNMQLGDPWHKEILRDDGLTLLVYAPKGGVKTTGAMFHLVMRHIETDTLSSYVTRMYKPIKVKHTKLFEPKMSINGRDMIFLMLFPSYPPKAAHLTIVVCDLTIGELKPFRRDIHLTTAEYNDILENDVVQYDVSQTYGPTGSSYVFVNIRGELKAFSLTSGRQIVMMEREEDRFSGFPGCLIDASDWELPRNLEVSLVCSKGKMYAVFYGQKINYISIITFTDTNSYRQRRAMWKSYEVWTEHQVMPIEQRCNFITQELADTQHPSVYMRSLVIECMDKAIRQSDGVDFTNDFLFENQAIDKIENYLALQEEVEKSDLLIDTAAKPVEEDPEEKDKTNFAPEDYLIS